MILRLLPLLLALLVSLPAGAREAVMRRRITTSDGVSLALYRYVPPGGGASRPPVLLVPDLTLGREAFDVRGSGLARWLQARGREVFIVELRGHGRSGIPKSWRLEHIVTQDLPAVLTAIEAVRPGPVDLIAHGYAGTLALVSTTRELRGRIRKVVALSTPVEPGGPSPALGKILAEGGGFSRLALDPAGAKVFVQLYARRGHFAPRRLAALRATGLNDLGRAAALDLLGWMNSGDLQLGESTVLERLRDYDRPTHQVLALGDSFANPEFGSPLRELAPKAPVEVRLLSRIQLMAEDYTHLSILHGKHAATDVFAPALHFLDRPETPLLHVESTP